MTDEKVSSWVRAFGTRTLQRTLEDGYEIRPSDVAELLLTELGNVPGVVRANKWLEAKERREPRYESFEILDRLTVTEKATEKPSGWTISFSKVSRVSYSRTHKSTGVIARVFDGSSEELAHCVLDFEATSGNDMKEWLKEHGTDALLRALAEGYSVRKGIADHILEQLCEDLDMPVHRSWKSVEERTSPRAESFAQADIVRVCVKLTPIPSGWKLEISRISRFMLGERNAFTGVVVSIEDDTRHRVQIAFNFEGEAPTRESVLGPRASRFRN